MTGRKLLSAVSLLLPALAPVGALAADVKAQPSTHLLRYYDPFRDKLQGDLLQYSFVSGDPGACVHNGWYAARLLYDPLSDPDNTVVYSGNKAEFFR